MTLSICYPADTVTTNYSADIAKGELQSLKEEDTLNGQQGNTSMTLVSGQVRRPPLYADLKSEAVLLGNAEMITFSTRELDCSFLLQGIYGSRSIILTLKGALVTLRSVRSPQLVTLTSSIVACLISFSGSRNCLKYFSNVGPLPERWT